MRLACYTDDCNKHVNGIICVGFSFTALILDGFGSIYTVYKWCVGITTKIATVTTLWIPLQLRLCLNWLRKSKKRIEYYSQMAPMYAHSQLLSLKVRITQCVLCMWMMSKSFQIFEFVAFLISNIYHGENLRTGNLDRYYIVWYLSFWWKEVFNFSSICSIWKCF